MAEPGAVGLCCWQTGTMPGGPAGRGVAGRPAWDLSAWRPRPVARLTEFLQTGRLSWLALRTGRLWPGLAEAPGVEWPPVNKETYK